MEWESRGGAVYRRRYCQANMYCDSPHCMVDEWRGTSASWKMPLGANGMLTITAPEQHYRVQLASQSEPLLLSPYDVEPYPQTLDLAYDMRVPLDARMCWMGETVEVRHFLAAMFGSETDRSYDTYTGHYRCTTTIYARPEHVVCTDDKPPVRNLFQASTPWSFPKAITLACTRCNDCSHNAGSKVSFTRLHELAKPCEPPAGGWNGQLRVGARAMLKPPHPLAADPDTPDTYIVKAICKCGQCVELEQTLDLPHDQLEPYGEVLNCPWHHQYKCSHLGHQGSCSFPEDSDDESEPLAQPMSIEDGVLV